MSLRVLMGPGQLRVSKPGYDANATSLDNLIFMEGVTGLAPGLIGTATAGANASALVGLPDPGFIPLFFYTLVGGSYPLVSVNAEKTVIIFKNANSGTMTVRYFIFSARAMQ